MVEKPNTGVYVNVLKFGDLFCMVPFRLVAVCGGNVQGSSVNAENAAAFGLVGVAGECVRSE